MELKKSYWLSSPIASFQEAITVAIDTSRGIEKDMMFEIYEPDRTWNTKDQVVTVPGGHVGFAKAIKVGSDSSQLQVLRRWQSFHPGSWVVEHPNSIFALQINSNLPSTNSYFNCGCYFNARALYQFDWGFGVQAIRVTDSESKDDWGFGFAGFAIWRFSDHYKFDTGIKVGLDLDIPFRRDDNGEMVTTTLFSTHLGLISEILISSRTDLVLFAGYRLGVKSHHWQFSDEEDSIPGYWEDQPPKVDNSGIMFSAGLKFYLF